MATTRSPNYPAVSLPEALDLLTKLYQREKRSPADPERVAFAFGYNSMSGPARSKLSALRKFDLVEETGNGVRVSDLGMAILFPRDDAEKNRAIRAAATTPGLFRELASYPGASDENLISRLVRNGFTEAGAKLAVASFRKTMSLAPDEESGYDALQQEGTDVLAAPAVSERSRPAAAGGTLPGTAKAYGIPMPDGITAELRWVGGPMTKRALTHLRKWLDLYEETIAEAEAAATPGISPLGDRDSTEPRLLAERFPDGAQG